MKRLLFIFFTAIFLIVPPLSAQPLTGAIEGIAMDQATRSPLIGQLRRSHTQRACRAQRPTRLAACRLPAEPAHQLRTHARFSTGHATEQRHLLVVVECSDPSIDLLFRRHRRRRRRPPTSFHRCCDQVAVETPDVDEALERRRERSKSIRTGWFGGAVANLVLLDAKQPRKRECPLIAARDLRPERDQRE